MIYFDSAATTLQKPPQVAAAMSRAVGTLASPGRGGYPESARAAQVAYACREAAAELFDLEDPGRVIFTSSATHGANIAIRTLAKPGSTVVISGYEHNAVTRTLHGIPGVKVRVAAGPLFDRERTAAAFRRLIGEGADCVVCTHVSNVFGFILPMEDIADACAGAGVPFILDASQSAGCLPLSVKRLGAAFVFLPGHKGLYGPQGTGLLLCGGERGEALITGGTGSDSIRQDMPRELPDRLEAGTHNIPGIAGLLEGLRFVRSMGPGRILAHERQLAQTAMDGLAHWPGCRVFRGADPESQAGLFSLVKEGADAEELGGALARAGIAVRSGLHCAPLAHETAGTLETGTVRFSFSAFNTEEEVRAMLWAVNRL